MFLARTYILASGNYFFLISNAKTKTKTKTKQKQTKKQQENKQKRNNLIKYLIMQLSM
jgi:hypothetical protein